jgi:hypothetical protein
MTDHRSTLPAPIAEGSSQALTATVVDEAGAPIAGSALTALTLTLYDTCAGTILNGRDHVDVLGANGGQVSEAGVLTLELTPADNALLDAERTGETHVALLEWSYAGGTRLARHEIVFLVMKLGLAP